MVCKLKILSVALLIAGCGSGNSLAPDLTGVTVLKPNALAEYRDAFQKTKSCVEQNYTGPIHDGQPSVTIVDHLNDTPDMQHLIGQTDFNSIWLVAVGSDEGVRRVMTHESVHWLTGIGNEGHGTPLFEACSDY